MNSTFKRFIKISGVLASVGLFAIGSYNTFQVNVDSFMLDSEIKFVKRLDQMTGSSQSGRIVAHNGNWKSLAPKVENKVQIRKEKIIAKTEPTVKTFNPEPAIVEELNLNLSKVFHPNKDLKDKKVSGNLQAYYGVIDAIDFEIEGIASVSLSRVGKLSGNVFEYSFGEETYTAMLYEQTKNTYIVNLTTGPKHLQGLRLQFKGAEDQNFDLPNKDVSEEGQALAKDMDSTQENFDKGAYREEAVDNTKEQEMTPSYGFNFSS